MKPMLAQNWNKVRKVHKALPLIAQPKIDGMRCLYIDGKFYTRNEKEIVSVPRLLDEVIKNFPKDVILDGELYCHNESFEFNQSVCRRTKNVIESDLIEYWLFDIIDSNVCYRRLELLDSMYTKNESSRIKVLPWKYVMTNVELENYLNILIKGGYEGIMLRNPMGLYEVDKRSYNLLKYKKFDDEECLIVGYEEGTGRLTNSLGSVVVKLENGKFVSVGSGFTDSDRSKIWLNKAFYLGEYMTIRYQEKTSNGVPRFPTFVKFRYD